jgi:hypothetical protein
MAQRMMIGLHCLGGGVMAQGSKTISPSLFHHWTIQAEHATSITTSRAMILLYPSHLHTRNAPGVPPRTGVDTALPDPGRALQAEFSPSFPLL